MNTLVIGGGPAGLAAALEISRLGFIVDLVEKLPDLGGKSILYCCKATEACNRCGVCHAVRRIKEAQTHPRIRVHLNTEVTAVHDHETYFTVHALENSVQEIDFTAGKIVWAGGFDFFAAESRKAYGYGRLPDVITSVDLEKKLLHSETLLRPSTGKPPETLAFIQCVGSRDLRFTQGHCSQVCCAYAVCLAKVLKHQDSHLQMTVFYMDLQAPSREFTQVLDRAGDVVRLVRGLPGEILSDPSGRLLVRTEIDNRDVLENGLFDMVVLSVGIHPLKIPEPVMKPLNIRTNQHGFVDFSPSSRVAVAGTAAGPMTIMNTMAHAAAVVYEMAAAPVKS
jgi:heterodisulfide reductase subunit A2